MTDTTTNVTPARRGRPRLRPIGQPRDNKVEYARRKALAKARGAVATVTNPVGANDRMQGENWGYTFAYARYLAWASNKPQAIVVYYHIGRLRFAIRCANGSLPLCCDAELVWVPVPPRMPRIPCDV